MKYYHGSNMIIARIDLSISRNRVDFGKGFYLTDKLGIARNWAFRKVELEGEGIPTIICYELSKDIFNLTGVRFPTAPNLEWLEFVCSNRSINAPNSVGKEPRHEYNWVTGPIADDKVVDVVAEYMREEISGKDAIKRLRALPQTYQLSIHTPAALCYVDDEIVMYKQFKAGRWTQGWTQRK